MILDTTVSHPSPVNQIFDRRMSLDAFAVQRNIYPNDDPDTSYSLGISKEQLLNGLETAIKDAYNDNWDGYDASPADISSLDYAISFIYRLSSQIPSPEISIDNDGEVAIEWDYGPRRIISIRIGRDGTLHYAGLVGYSSFHGVEQYHENIPEPIFTGILRVVEAT